MANHTKGSECMSPLAGYYTKGLLEAGCDEAGRGCLAGPVFAAAVILPPDYQNGQLNDSKQLTAKKRDQLRRIIEDEALAYGVAFLTNVEIDQHNILKSSFMAMHRALDQLSVRPQQLLIDGNRFIPYASIPHHCMVKGDARFLSIAAASVLAKTYRDEFMEEIHLKYPWYNWQKNKGYPTRDHRAAIMEKGACEYHRKSFRLLPAQLEISFG